MNENLLVLLAVVAFSFLFYSVPIYFLYKWEKKHENDPIDGYTIITRIVCVALALFYQHLKSNGLYFGILINGFIYITLGYFIVFYRHKPKTINKEKTIEKPKKQKENKISKTQYFLAIIYIFYEWIAQKVIGLICKKEQPRKQKEQIKYPIVKKLSLFVFIFLIFGYELYDDFLYSFRRSIGLDRDITDILYIVLLIVFCYLSFRKQKDKKIDKILLKIETKLQKPYQFAKLHFIEICLALIALALLKIAF